MDAAAQRKVIKRLKAAGYDVTPDGPKRKVWKNGKLVGRLPNVGRVSDCHAWDNCLSDLRTATGIDFRSKHQGKRPHATA